jgi:hypothetical protein
MFNQKGNCLLRTRDTRSKSRRQLQVSTSEGTHSSTFAIKLAGPRTRRSTALKISGKGTTTRRQESPKWIP